MQLTVARTMESLQEGLLGFAQNGQRVALVPTMGALHAGHMSLVRRAKDHADAVVVYIFVNPKQFGANEDLSKYPRSLEADIEKSGKAGAAMVYAPSAEDVYPPGFSLNISVGALSTILEGKSRPGHFDGVATVLAKMFIRILPHAVLLGEKDYQQLCVVRKLVEDIDLPIDIIGAPTVRESDGLAMSSRNVYLSEEQRRVAPTLFEVMNNAREIIASGQSPVQAVLEQGIAVLGKAGFKVDYLELRKEDTLEPTDKAPGRLLAAAWLGNTRLIDNIALSSRTE